MFHNITVFFFFQKQKLTNPELLNSNYSIKDNEDIMLILFTNCNLSTASAANLFTWLVIIVQAIFVMF